MRPPEDSVSSAAFSFNLLVLRCSVGPAVSYLLVKTGRRSDVMASSCTLGNDKSQMVFVTY